jgi:hypothetical protein
MQSPIRCGTPRLKEYFLRSVAEDPLTKGIDSGAYISVRPSRSSLSDQYHIDHSKSERCPHAGTSLGLALVCFGSPIGMRLTDSFGGQSEMYMFSSEKNL